MKKLNSILKAIASGLVWGVGQLFNRQYIKAVMFFAFFFILFGTEILTGHYFNPKKFDVYGNINGEYFGDSTSRKLAINLFNTDYLDSGYVDHEYLNALKEISGIENVDGAWITPADKAFAFTADDLIEMLGSRVRRIYDSHIMYYDADVLDSNGQVIHKSGDRVVDAYGQYVLDFDIEARIKAQAYAEQMKVSNAHDMIDSNYPDKVNNPIYEQALADQIVAEYTKAFALEYNTVYKKLYDDALLADPLIKFAKEEFDLIMNHPSYSSLSGDDWAELTIRVYYAAFPEQYASLVNSVDDYLYVNGGFFGRGIWGLFTLGTSPIRSIEVANSLSVINPTSAVSVSLFVHNSVSLMLYGIIGGIVLVFFAIIYIWNIRDAYNTSINCEKERIKAQNEGRKPVYQTEGEYFKEMYAHSFAYIVVLPSIILMAFVTFMPIIFSFLVAFTNYDKDHIPPGQLFQWVGLENFASLFNFSGSSAMPFGDVFWRVTAWTLIWAVGSTFTCFFGGFLQAIILNNERVVFRKFWRTILILPWAVPALVSQMMFKLFFNTDNGAMNKFVDSIGLRNFLVKNKFIVTEIEDLTAKSKGNFIDKFFYLGKNAIQWYDNPVNPWLPRLFIIVLNIWLGFPYFMAMMSGVMTSISKDLYEAAEIDGATKFQQFQKITVPLVLYSTAPLLIMSFSSNFNNFGVIYFVTDGGYKPGQVRAFAGMTDILLSWIYTLTTGDTNMMYSMASVFSILIFIVVASISTYNFLQTKSFKEEDMI